MQILLSSLHPYILALHVKLVEFVVELALVLFAVHEPQ